MAPVNASEAQAKRNGNLTPPEINALLFYRLGQFVVWGQEHKDLAAGDSRFSALLETATWALSHGGVREPGNWAATAGADAADSQNAVSDTQY